MDVALLIPFAAGNYLYVGAADLMPEVNKHRGAWRNGVHLVMFVLGLVLMCSVKVLFEG